MPVGVLYGMYYSVSLITCSLLNFLKNKMNSTLYDQIPYTKNVYKRTHPNNLATIASLHGLQPPTVENCQVLELGCASGINTIAMATITPQSEFIGIDASEKQIAEGRANIQHLSLKNIQLKAMDMMTIDDTLGKFDYIIAHGVYSWVAEPARNKLLQVCRDHLQPQGIAYVSYNVYPGWHQNHALRTILRYHTRHLPEPQAQLESAKQCIRLLNQTLASHYDTHSLNLKKLLQRIDNLGDHYLFHEYLEPDNHPVYFHEFLAHTKQYDLQYISDTDLAFALPRYFPQETLSQFGPTLMEQEQYLDFLRDNSFRESLLCHQAVSIKRSRHYVEKLYVAANIKANSTSISLDEGMLEEFSDLSQGEGRMALAISSPTLKAICVCLSEHWPQNLAFETLIQLAYQRLDIPNISLEQLPEVMLDDIKILLLDLYLKKIVEFSTLPSQFITHITEKPLASPLARLQSLSSEEVYNVRYEKLSLNFLERYLLPLLNGQNDEQALLKAMLAGVENGELILSQGENEQNANATLLNDQSEVLLQQIRSILQVLSKRAYLVA